MTSRENADFDDDRLQLNKDAQTRRRFLGWFNNRREDFDSDTAYDDYLETVEELIHNQANNIDIDATKARVDKYRQQNQHRIGQNQAKRADELREDIDKIATLDRARLSRLEQLRKQDEEREEERQKEHKRQRAEEILRISKGDDAVAKLRRKRDKAERKKRRKDAAEVRKVEEQARADEQAVLLRPTFSHPVPVPVGVGNVSKDFRPMEREGMHDPQIMKRAATAAGFQQNFVYNRALKEFNQALLFSEQQSKLLC